MARQLIAWCLEQSPARCELDSSGGHLTTGTVEALLEKIAALSPEPTSSIETFELDVPQHLTLSGRPVAPDVAMAVILDGLFAKGFDPDGFEPRPGGRRYRYRRG
jgi:hypothetical protein